jgi:DNA-binding transcriptional ArsR family regulator
VALGLSQPTISRHLQQLEAAGYLVSEREGPWVVYALKPRDAKAQALLDLVLPWVSADTELQALIKRALTLDRYECSREVRGLSSEKTT